MTEYGRDASDYDWTSGTGPDWTGLAFATNKATEGTDPNWDHVHLADALTHARGEGVPVLGAYHVVRTPGNAGTGTIAAQVDHYLARLDAVVPWWRVWPHWMHQVDAEKWPYDNVSPDTIKSFAARLVATDPHRFAVTYASRGQYGDTLTGIVTPLWNADYDGSAGGSYPGDGWTAHTSGTPAGWAPYSGQTPPFLQYTSTPYDKDAFRGTLADLLALTAGGPDVNLTDPVPGTSTPGMGDRPVETVLSDVWNAITQGKLSGGGLWANSPFVQLLTAVKGAAATGAPTQDQVNAAMLAAMQDPTVQAGLAAAIATHLHVS